MAPKAIGPYSQAIIAGNYIYCSGQIAINPTSGILVSGGVTEQTKQVLDNIKNILIAVESDLSQVVKTEVYLKNIRDFEVVNEIYAKYFKSDPLPARVTVEVSKLPKDSLIEVSCIAYKK